MATIVELPRLSDTMEEGVVAKWLIQVGDKVKRGQVIAEIETDKATMEFETFDGGIVLKLVAEEGDTLALGAPIAVLGKEGEDPDAALQEHGGAASAGAPVAASSSAPETQTPSPASAASASSTPAPSPAPAASPAVVVDADSKRIPASPMARRLAHEAGLQLSQISGSGPHGRVVKADVERAVTEGPTSTASTGAPVASLSRDVDDHGRPYASRENSVVRISQMRKAIVRSMTTSKFSAPHFYLTIDLEMNEAVRVRGLYNAALEDGKISYNDLVISAAAKALRAHPRVNAAYTEQGIVEYGDVNVGVAVAIDDGLVVPVVHHAEQKTLIAIAREVRDYGQRAKTKHLRPEEMQGGTFTVSNLGMFGIEQFTAVINPGEGAIMAVGGLRDEVVLVDGTPKVAKRMRVTLSSDHRVIDGAVGAQFLQTFRGYLENPMRLFT